MAEVTLLLERDAALTAVDDLLGAAREGRGGALFVSAEAGVGKSALLAEAVQRAAGFRAGVGRGDGMEATLPYGVVQQAIGELGGAATLRLFEPGPAASDARSAVFYGVVNWLSEAATEPLLLAVDDLQWADADSLALVAAVCRRLRHLPVAVVATMRPFPPAAADLARSLAAGGEARRLALAPLTAEATAGLLAARHGDVGADVLATAWQLTAGNPLLIEQVAALLDRGAALPAPGAEAGAGHELLVSRFAGAGDAALELARAASIFGVNFPVRRAVALSGLGDQAADAALEALARAGIITVTAPAVAAFVHPLFASAVYDEIPAALRARRHARAFDLLQRDGGGLMESAEQARRSDLVGDDTAIGLLVRAGRAAIRAGSGEIAERHLGAAVALGGGEAPPPTRVALAEAHLLAGHPAAAVAAAAAVDRSGLDPVEEMEALRMLGRAHFYAGELPQSDAAYDAAARVSAARDDAETAAEVALEYAAVALFAAGPAVSLAAAKRARDIAGGSSAPVADAAVIAWALNAWLADPSIEAVTAAAGAAAALQRRGEVDRAASLALHGALLTAAERFSESAPVLATARRWAERTGDPVIIGLIATASAADGLRRGALEEALGHSAAALAMADLGPAGGAWAAALRAETLLQLGRDGECDAMTQIAEDQAAARHEWLPLMWVRATALRRDIDAGRTAAASRAALWLEERFAAHGVGDADFVPWRADAVVAHAAVGADDALRRLHAAAVNDHAATGRACAAAAAALAAALIAEAAGDIDAAAAHLDAAVAATATLPLEAVRLRLEHGRLLRRNARSAAARAVLGDAVRAATELGAVRLAALATAELHVAGGRRRRRHGDDELTAAEVRVARLAADGLSNAEIAAALFVSSKTVDTHLQHIYAKLGINSRRELMRLVPGEPA